ncbi:MAG TPA: hypothetical protein EYG97_02205 [Arcobacter sp.]|nr:hypothetical protein [Arcobacter sp.]HIP55814.1 hypothetical protein [Arcobacter sp.]
MNSNIQDLIKNLPIPQINLSNARLLAFTKIQSTQFEIEFGEMILGPYSFRGTIEEFIDVYFSQIAKINHFEEQNIKQNLISINKKNNYNYSYSPKEISYILNIA